jgi:hypothetical protein
MIYDLTSVDGRLDPHAPLTALRESVRMAKQSIELNETSIVAFQQRIKELQTYIAIQQTEVKLYEDALAKLERIR